MITTVNIKLRIDYIKIIRGKKNTFQNNTELF